MGATAAADNARMELEAQWLATLEVLRLEARLAGAPSGDGKSSTSEASLLGRVG